MSTATAPALNRVIKGPHKGCIARVVGTKTDTGHVRCQIKNLDKGTESTDWMSPAVLEELVAIAPGTMCRITGGDCEGFFAQVQEHDPTAELYVGSAHCLVISPSGKQRNGWIEDKYLRPCNQIKLKAGECKAIATMTPQGMLLKVFLEDETVSHQTGKFLKSKSEAVEALEDYLDSRSPVPPSQNSVTETEEVEGDIVQEEPVESLSRNSVAQEEEDASSLEEPVEDEIEQGTEVAPPTESEASKKTNVLQFPARNSVIEQSATDNQQPITNNQEQKNPPDSESMGMPEETEAEEEDWIYLSSEREDRAEAIASKLIEISEPYVQTTTDFLWELKFVVFEDDRRKKSQTYGTFEQMCRHLHEKCSFPFHPNTSREKANAEQERRLLRQAGVAVEVEKMSDTAALELRKVDALKAEPEVILEAKRKVVGNASELTKKAIASSIRQLSKDEDWENQYKFRYGKPKPSSGEKPEPISRQELEEVQNRNTRLRKENETLREELQATKEELGYLRKDYKEKEKNETFLSDLLQTTQAQLDEKEREIAELKRELEEERRTILAG